MPAARPSDADLRRAVAIVKAEGVVVEVARDGTFRIAPLQTTVADDYGLDSWKAKRARRADARSA